MSKFVLYLCTVWLCFRNTLDTTFQESAAPAIVAVPVVHSNANAHAPLHNALAVARSYAAGSLNNPLHNWQATKHTLKERFSFMFCNEILADVHFIVGRGDQAQVSFEILFYFHFWRSEKEILS